MNYIRTNKDAWEEAFENRKEGWGEDIVSRVKSEHFPFFEKEMIAVLERLTLTGAQVAQFCSNNGRELLSLVHAGAAGGTGFDIAENQVAFANSRAKELGSPCRFIAANILDLDDEYTECFDLAIITIGALCWFKDLTSFFAVVSRSLKKGGKLIINEQHPVTNMLGAPGEEGYEESRPASCVHSYFDKEWIEEDGMYYLTGKSYKSKPFINYTHSLSEIIGSMCAKGLVITDLKEFDYDISGMFAHLERKGIPLSCIIQAEKR